MYYLIMILYTMFVQIIGGVAALTTAYVLYSFYKYKKNSNKIIHTKSTFEYYNNIDTELSRKNEIIISVGDKLSASNIHNELKNLRNKSLVKENADDIYMVLHYKGYELGLLKSLSICDDKEVLVTFESNIESGPTAYVKMIIVTT
jgi:altronate dehydratase